MLGDQAEEQGADGATAHSQRRIDADDTAAQSVYCKSAGDDLPRLTME
jgi:hypothetical protein